MNHNLITSFDTKSAGSLSLAMAILQEDNLAVNDLYGHSIKIYSRKTVFEKGLLDLFMKCLRDNLKNLGNANISTINKLKLGKN